jgi:hypothetical protein
MTTEELLERVKALPSEKQASVAEFIDYLEHVKAPTASPFLQAAEQFIAEHPDLLRRLAQ